MFLVRVPVSYPRVTMAGTEYTNLCSLISQDSLRCQEIKSQQPPHMSQTQDRMSQLVKLQKTADGGPPSPKWYVHRVVLCLRLSGHGQETERL